ncbi:Hypothetical predicted protein [Cloeon dipterum]|nr:Hypothetical predicted protein [Cloeon dipterum]
MTFSPVESREDNFLKLLHEILTLAPNVQILSVVEDGIKLQEDQRILDLLNSQTNLKSLHTLDCANLQVLYTTLAQLCSVVESLRHVNVQINYTDGLLPDLNELKSSFCRLKVFLFTVWNEEQHERTSSPSLEDRFWRLCVRELLNLEIVGRPADDPSLMHGNQRVIELPASTSNLRHLVTRANNLGMHLAFPNVTHLNIHLLGCVDRNKINAMLQFSSQIESLILICPQSGAVVSEFLARYGPTLKNLVIKSTWTALRYKFEPIFSLCPGLKKLTLFNVEMMDDMQTMKTLKELTHFEWLPPKRPYIERCATLSNILISAPNLQRLKIQSEWFFTKDLENISNLIVEQKILQKLELFHFDHVSDEDIPACFKIDRKFEQFAAFFPVFSDLMKNAIAYCPVLIDVDVFVELNDQDVDYRVNKRCKHGVPPSKELWDDEALRLLGEKELARFLKICS